MSNKTFIIVFSVITLIGVLSSVALFMYTAKLQKEASIIAIVSNEDNLYEA